MRRCSRSKLGRPLVVEGDDLAVEHRLAHAEIAQQPAHLGIGVGDLAQVAALQPQPARLDVGDRADPVPLDLERPVLLGARQVGGRSGQHRDDPLGHRLALRIRRRIHAVDHPVLVRASGVAADREQPVAAVEPLAVEGDLDLLVGPHVRLERPPVPDPHRARRRTPRPGSRPRTRGTRAGGPRCGPPAGSPTGRAGCRWGSPTRPAPRRARAAGPSAAGWRGAPGPRTGPARRRGARPSSPAGSLVAAKSRLAR